MSDANAEIDLETCALAFRGYNITNLGRTRELLSDDRYHNVVQRYLDQCSAICAEIVGRPVDLAARVRRGEEASLAEYDEAIALVVGVELAQIELFEARLGAKLATAHMAFGYSLGEIVALAASGSLTLDDALRIPISMAADCAALAADVTMAVVFSRSAALGVSDMQRLCVEVNARGEGVIGISALLSPNSLLVLGQRDTVGQLERLIRERMPVDVHLRRNSQKWPPLHTPIVWQKNISNRAAVMMHTLNGSCRAPQPPLLSLVTGKYSNTDDNVRDLIMQWIDHPQRLWDAVCETLASGVKTVIHVGPEANLIPATFDRISKNVVEQTEGGSLVGRLGRATMHRLARLAWLRGVLPTRAALLRAPRVRHVRLEDWLLDTR
jgi:[acyl-carrier-protein] S-malonyltransferase